MGEAREVWVVGRKTVGKNGTDHGAWDLVAIYESKLDAMPLVKDLSWFVFPWVLNVDNPAGQPVVVGFEQAKAYQEASNE